LTGAAAAARFRAFAQAWLPRVDAELERLLPPGATAPARLHDAMRYALFPGGKRLRPMLALLGCQATGGDPARVLTAAAGLECLHTYSLVHDDLPCMDDDDLRRGRPTCHAVYGEAVALLVGDALQALAFEAVASGGAHAVAALALAAGSRGMVGGQMGDIEAEGGGADRSLARVEWIHDRKTGALLTASLLVGALAGAQAGSQAGSQAGLVGGTALPPAVALPLTAFGDRLGRAFQIADDCLDLTGTAEELGKRPNADAEHQKLTWPSVVGLERSLQMARELAAAAAGLAPAVVDAAAAWRGARTPELDAAVPLLQDAAYAAVERRS
jgi:geranylgeranyl diphosphate synthase type II